jgi:hypothetical protein
MSKPSAPIHGEASGGHAHQAEDQIDFPKIIAVGVVSLVIFALATWWAYIILVKETGQIEDKGKARVASEMGKDEIGIVDQPHFDHDNRLEVWRKARSQHLNGYGWIDRKRGIIHIPIEKAMEELLAGAPPVAPAAVPGTAPRK